MSRKSKRNSAQKEMAGTPAKMPAAVAAARRGYYPSVVISLGLVLAVCLVFGQTLRHEFITFDDGTYIYNNSKVSPGLTVDGILWAFTTSGYASNWHPLTWLSHMLDCQLHGLRPGGHHLTSLLLHAAAAVLLFLGMRQLTGRLWRSAFVAAVFAVHPLRVESVAWAAERKDVLSGFFFMLTLLAYGRYASASKSQSPMPMASFRQSSSIFHSPAARWYGLLLLSFACGLMSKPMLVTLPFVLLLLDYWPLKRFSIGAFRSAVGWLILEKLPLLGMAGLSGAATILAQNKAIHSFEDLPLIFRLKNALIAGVVYLKQMVWPAKLAVFYPYPTDGYALWQIVGAVVFLPAASILAFRLRRKHPYVLTGWFWYLVMLLPVIGVIQVGGQTHADRYTYLPQIGIYLVLTWGLTEALVSWCHRTVVLSAAAVATILVLIALAGEQAARWRNSVTLWTHTLASTSNNRVAHNNLAAALYALGRTDEANAHFKTALELGGVESAAGGATNDAVANFRTIVAMVPQDAAAHYNYGSVLDDAGQADEAAAQLRMALEIDPRFASAHVRLGNILLQKQTVNEAIGHYQKALAITPDDVLAHNNLGRALLRAGDVRGAIAHLERALALQPGSELAGDNLAWVLATCTEASIRNGVRAVALAENANRSSGGINPLHLRTLAAAYAENGQNAQAVATARRAERLAVEQDRPDLVEALREQIKLYQAGKPFRDADFAIQR